MSRVTFDSIETALAAIADGGILVVADDEDRENEGDLVMAADRVTTESLAFFVRHTSGLICVGLTGGRCDELQLPQMVPPSANIEQHATAFTFSVDVREGTTTGISAADRRRRSRLSPTRPLDPPTSTGRDTSSRSGRDRALSSNLQATPKRPSTSPVSQGARRPACCARWCWTTARWPAPRTSPSSRSGIDCR